VWEGGEGVGGRGGGSWAEEVVGEGGGGGGEVPAWRMGGTGVAGRVAGG